MKRFALSLFFLLVASVSLHAMSFNKAREYAYFLTDKMAYELNLTNEQYERCYEVNLDYFLSIDRDYDLYGDYWHFRDNDLRYILFDWQYALYRAADYFFRPVAWVGNGFSFSIYNRYRTANYFYYDRPRIYVNYRGSNWARRSYNAVSPYRGMVFSGRHGGMREQYVPMQGYGYNYNNGHRYNDSYSYHNYYGSQYNNGRYHFDNGNHYGQYKNGNNGRNNRGNSYSSDYNFGRGEASRGGNFNTGNRNNYAPSAGSQQNGTPFVRGSRSNDNSNAYNNSRGNDYNNARGSQFNSRGGNFSGSNSGFGASRNEAPARYSVSADFVRGSRSSDTNRGSNFSPAPSNNGSSRNEGGQRVICGRR